MTLVSFPEWLPDLPDFGNPGSSVITNVMPQQGSYGPVPSPGRYTSNGLTNRCQGSYSIFDSAGNAFVFAGDSTRLYSMVQGSRVLADVSRTASFTASMAGTVMTVTVPDANGGTISVGDTISGAAVHFPTTVTSFGTGSGGTGTYNISFSQTLASESMSSQGGGPYATPAVTSGGFWSMTSFGSKVIATNGVDPIQSYDVASSSRFANLASTAPKAKYAATIRDFLVVGNTVDGVSGAVPYRVWWPAIGDATNWPTPGSTTAQQVQSDYQDLQQSDLGRVQGIVGGLSSADGAVFMEGGIYRVAYVGSPAIFKFTVAQGASGTHSPLSIVQRRLQLANGATTSVAFYLAEEGFYAFDGSTSIPIGANKFDRTFFRDLDHTYLNYVIGVADPRRKIVAWAYMGNGSAGLYNRIIAYDWSLNKATSVDLGTAGFEWVTRAIYGTGYTLDQLDPFGTVDTLPASLDDPMWTGNGEFTLSGFGATTHRLQTMTGPPLAPTLETSEQQMFPGRRTRIINARPLVDATGGTISVGHRERLTDPVVYEPAVPVNVIGECPQLCTGRYVRFRLTLPASTRFQHLQGVDIDAKPDSTLR